MPPNNQPPAPGQQPPVPQPPVQPPAQQQPAPIGAEPQVAANMQPVTQASGQPGQPNPNDTAVQQKQQATNKTTSQRSLLFSELRDNMIVLNDGGFRAVISCQSINFDLMSNRERESVEYSYQNFLNSLYFHIQILVRSRRVDIAPYLERLDDIRRSQDNMLLNVLMDDYINFVDALAENANIMEKSFYIVIPYSPDADAAKLVEQSKGFFSQLFGSKKASVNRIDQDTYNKVKDELNTRVESVMSGLFQVGIQASRLNTKQLGELYYNSYNPDTSVNQPLGDFGQNTSTFVRKGAGTPPPVHHPNYPGGNA